MPWPAMQSRVEQVPQVASERGATSTGDSSDDTKLNCPSGHTYLQNEASRKTESTANAVAKYASSSTAVRMGEFHRASPSYAQKNRTTSATGSHLLRSARGQIRPSMPR